MRGRITRKQLISMEEEQERLGLIEEVDHDESAMNLPDQSSKKAGNDSEFIKQFKKASKN